MMQSIWRPLRIATRSLHTSSLALQNAPTIGSISRLQQPIINNNTTTTTTQNESSSAPASHKKKIREEIVKYVIHCNFAKNNTIMTLTSVIEDLNFEQNNSHLSFNEKVLYYINLPERTLTTISTGNLGFRKWQRGEYEASHKTAAKLFEIMESKNYLGKNIELVYQDFGKGRKAFEDALLGKPGNAVRPFISRISDVTKIKFGGDRSPRRRRL